MFRSALVRAHGASRGLVAAFPRAGALRRTLHTSRVTARSVPQPQHGQQGPRGMVKGKPQASSVQVAATVAKKGINLVFVVGGALVAGGLLYAVGKELLGADSATSVYDRALDVVRESDAAQVRLGRDGILGRGRLNSRGRGRHVDSQRYVREGSIWMAVVFFVKGSHGAASVRAEAIQTDGGAFELRHVVMRMDGTNEIVKLM